VANELKGYICTDDGMQESQSGPWVMRFDAEQEIGRLELDSRTHDSQYKVMCEENAALKAQVAALAELSAPFTQEEMDSVDHCACVYCRAKWSLLLVARLAAAQCQHLRTERSQLTHKPGTYTCMDCGALVTEQQLGDAIAAEQEGGK
jgi:hypothetical protein